LGASFKRRPARWAGWRQPETVISRDSADRLTLMRKFSRPCVPCKTISDLVHAFRRIAAGGCLAHCCMGLDEAK
jgi:hypothetical protein